MKATNNMEGSVTITLTKDSYCYNNFSFKKYDIVEVKALGRSKYNIVLNDSFSSKILDEDGENALSVGVTLRPLSKYKILRKIQIFIIKLCKQ